MASREIREDLIQQGLDKLSGKKVCLGFDGFVDTIARVIRHRDGSDQYFQTIREFASHLLEKSTSSLGLQLGEVHKRRGGNMPNVAEAMSSVGAVVTCVGVLGQPQIDPAFSTLDKCTLYSFGEPGTSTALEFDNGKVLLGNAGPLATIRWNEVAQFIANHGLPNVFSEADLIGFLNWSEIRYATEIWSGVMSLVSGKPTRSYALIDLCDCSDRPVTELREVLSLIKAFTESRRVVISLNRREAQQVLNALEISAPFSPMEICTSIRETLRCYCVVIHMADSAVCSSAEGGWEVRAINVAQPVLLTGAGDTFNAGVACGLLMELSLRECVFLGHLFSSFYISQGRCLTPDELKDRYNLFKT